MYKNDNLICIYVQLIDIYCFTTLASLKIK